MAARFNVPFFTPLPTTYRWPTITEWCSRNYRVLALAVLTLAAFNLAFRLGSEIVIEWDEALYAISASEIVKSGDWIGITFLGDLDYYNAKPPLNVWLIALAFKLFGTSLVSLRLVSAVSAWLTVAVLTVWARRCFGAAVALFAGLVLATSFGFVYVHAGRNANTDAVFALLILLTVVTLWASQDRPWTYVWLGPIAAAVFLLRGMAVLMPLSIVMAVELSRARSAGRWKYRGLALLFFVAPVMAWAFARWRVDGFKFFDSLLNYDFVARTLTALEGHPGGPFYYLNILQKDQYDWLLAGVAALILFPVPWSRVSSLVRFWRGGDSLKLLIGCWAVMTLLIPTLMSTKVPWYLNSFYPVFAIGIAGVLVHGFAQREQAPRAGRRRAILALVVVVAIGVAEGKLMWYWYHRRDLKSSVQGLLMAEKGQLRGHRVFRDHWDRAEIFVLTGLLEADYRVTGGEAEFLRESRPEDYLLSSNNLAHADLVLMRTDGQHSLYGRRK